MTEGKKKFLGMLIIYVWHEVRKNTLCSISFSLNNSYIIILLPAKANAKHFLGQINVIALFRAFLKSSFYLHQEVMLYFFPRKNPNGFHQDNTPNAF